jgi:hypothetical protein
MAVVHSLKRQIQSVIAAASVDARRGTHLGIEDTARFMADRRAQVDKRLVTRPGGLAAARTD